MWLQLPHGYRLEQGTKICHFQEKDIKLLLNLLVMSYLTLCPFLILLWSIWRGENHHEGKQIFLSDCAGWRRFFLCSWKLHAISIAYKQHHQTPYPISSPCVSSINDHSYIYPSEMCTLLPPCIIQLVKGAQGCIPMANQANPREKHSPPPPHSPP